MAATEEPVVVVASFRPKPDADGDVQQILEGMVEPSRAEPGCERYDLYRGEEGFHLVERYESGDALEAHRATEHYRLYREAIVDHLADPIAVLRLDPIDVRP